MSFIELERLLDRELAVEDNIDLIRLPLSYGGKKFVLYAVDGFIKDEAWTQIQRELSHLHENFTLDHLLQSAIPYVEITTEKDPSLAMDAVLAGQALLLVEDESKMILLDTRTYPVRSPEEPDTERVVRGARDGFVETFMFNLALIRRRVRDKSLRTNYLQIGKRSKTDVCLVYMEGIASDELVEEVRSRLKQIDVDGLPMADKTLEEYVFGHFYHPYPLVRYTERPDVCASHLFEGHIVIVVDGSPSVILAPATFWHHLQHAEEFRQKPVIGSGMRLIRMLAVWMSIFLLPIWFTLVSVEGLLPDALSFIGINELGEIPLILQFIFAEIGVEMLRMAAIHTPSALATALGLVAAILIGEVAVEVGLFSYEVVLYVAIVSIGSFATSSYELSLANRYVRQFLLLSVAFFQLPGLIIGTTMVVILLVYTKSLNAPYLWPFLPFSYKAFKSIVFRSPIPLLKRRPSIVKPIDQTR
ncbi:spore germination protein [Paenalkalicoccus suaedae]|uniref:Spore germination protein n=1 Tax=Paenalkalicoccus suaedae TaxID=2592382 RepID=A0A859FDJ6_9BACI|nr:spore germination protein [Paenalkalicoccus suaedae]QKS70918.1 spore germination protein [Paenalkalicoccus suaedae]